MEWWLCARWKSCWAIGELMNLPSASCVEQVSGPEQIHWNQCRIFENWCLSLESLESWKIQRCWFLDDSCCSLYFRYITCMSSTLHWYALIILHLDTQLSLFSKCAICATSRSRSVIQSTQIFCIRHWGLYWSDTNFMQFPVFCLKDTSGEQSWLLTSICLPSSSW